MSSASPYSISVTPPTRSNSSASRCSGRGSLLSDDVSGTTISMASNTDNSVNVASAPLRRRSTANRANTGSAGVSTNPSDSGACSTFRVPGSAAHVIGFG